MTDKMDVTVIGAGIVGMAAAINLQRSGHSVTVIDRGGPGSGASKGNAGELADCGIIPVTVPGIWKKIPGMLLDPVGALSLDWVYVLKRLPWFAAYLRNSSSARVEKIAQGLWHLVSNTVAEHQLLAKGTGVEDLVRPSPFLFVYPDEGAFKAEKFSWQLRKKYGIAYDVLLNGEVQDMDPVISRYYRFALVLKRHGFLRDPLGLVRGLADHFVSQGGVVHRADVGDIEVGPEGPRKILTSIGSLDVEALLICAGAWSGQFASRLGTPVPLESERGYHVQLSSPGLMPKYPIMSTDCKVVATPMAMGLRFAGLVEFAGLAAPPNYQRAKVLLKHARRIFPGVNVEDFTEWMGHRPALPDSLPVIGRSPLFENVYFAFGHHHIGMTAGPKTGRIISQVIQGQVPDISIEPYSISRFV